mmetsp:Transcript_10455/g.15969  ORF Transcript_10455/g.15969 Transcript_10455/m.15969 type:complete len:433 (+) Transcript_10455:71-1369(+)
MIITRSKNENAAAPQCNETDGLESKKTFFTVTRNADNGYYYLTPEKCAALKRFQYRGGDNSLLYRYILSPFAQYLVDNFTPRWLAPNVITLSGLCLMLTSYSFMWQYIPHLDEGLTDPDAVPRWIFLFNCFAMLAYQSLDNMDGKQARRTGSSSPLGLLFDHGCDALVTLPGSINCACLWGVSFRNDPAIAWLTIVCPAMSFFMGTWEQYVTGEMYLPIINGPSEGLIAGAAFSLVSYLWGPEFWHSATAYDTWIAPAITSITTVEYESGRVRNCDIAYYIFLAWLVEESTTRIFGLARKYGPRAMLSLIPFALLSCASMTIYFLDSSFVLRNTRTCLHIFTAIFVEMTFSLQLNHMTDSEFRPFRYAMIPLGLIVLQLACKGGGSPDEFLLAYAAVLWIFLLRKISLVICDICDLLQIQCFRISYVLCRDA